MREILFRGKRIDNGKWEYGFYTTGRHFCGEKGEGMAYILDMTCPMFSRVVSETVGQYTGLKDADERPIFEGDVIEYYRPYDEMPVDGIVRFAEDKRNVEGSFICGFYVEWIDNKEFRVDLPYWAKSNAVIIGNIYDNPEIMKGEKGNAEIH